MESGLSTLRQTLAEIPPLLSQVDADASYPALTRDLAEKLRYVRDEILAETEALTPEEVEKDRKASAYLSDYLFCVEVVKTGKSRAAVVFFNSEYVESFVVFIRRTDGRAKTISLVDFLVACFTENISDEVKSLLRNWGLDVAIDDIANCLELEDREAVCEVSFDLV
jgi:hypothetical protein